MYADLKAEPIRLLLKPKEAAQALALSERTLWTLTNDGKIPVFREGRIVRYAVDDLRDWVKSKIPSN